MEEETNAKTTELEGNSSTESSGQSSFGKSTDHTIESPRPVIELDCEETPHDPLSHAASSGIAVELKTSEPIPPQVGEAASNKLPNEAVAGDRVVQHASQIPDAVSTKKIAELKGKPEVLRAGNGDVCTSPYLYPVNAVYAKDFQAMMDRGRQTCEFWRRSPLPTHPESYSTTTDLFTRIKLAISAQTRLSEKDSALLTFWVFSTWFKDALSVAPCLIISGWANNGEVVLRTLREFSSHGILMAGINSASLKGIRWDVVVTLLISEPNLAKRMADLIDCSTCRDYLALKEGEFFDFFGPKAVYVGEDLPTRSMRHSVHINASDTRRIESDLAVPPSEESTQHFQNQLFNYRIRNLQTVFKTNFKSSGLPPGAKAVADAFGSCIVDAPDLQAELVSLLMPQAQQQIAERLDELGTVAIDAALNLFHNGKNKILVGEIAAEVNRILSGRGGRLSYSPEAVGQKLKKMGLLSRRLGGAGNGFILDHATDVRLHEIAARYSCVGLVDDKRALKCPLCKQTKQLMEVV